MSGGSEDAARPCRRPRARRALGFPGTMADPKLALFNGSTRINANDNWRHPLPGVATVSAGDGGRRCVSLCLGRQSRRGTGNPELTAGRTAQVFGPAAGNVIVEVYDTVASNSPRLTNLSALNFVGTGGDVLIAGFTIAGTGAKNLLIRAAGPSLALSVSPARSSIPKLVLQSSGKSFVAENDTYALRSRTCLLRSEPSPSSLAQKTPRLSSVSQLAATPSRCRAPMAAPGRRSSRSTSCRSARRAESGANDFCNFPRGGGFLVHQHHEYEIHLFHCSPLSHRRRAAPPVEPRSRELLDFRRRPRGRPAQRLRSTRPPGP